MSTQRVLREIGRHPIGGVWVIAQLLPAVAWAYFLLSRERHHFGGSLAVIFLMFVIQLPTSVITHNATFALLPLSISQGMLLRVLACQWLFTACVNYVIFIYGVPALDRVIESRWPFERTYFRRR